MKTFLPDTYVLQPVTRGDLSIASLAMGFTIGFGWLTTWTAMKQSKQIWRANHWRMLRNAYFWMIWLEILVCLIFMILCYLYLLRVIPPSFAFYFCILTTWALQVQFLLQIIVNRCAILLTNKKRAYHLKVGVAVLITLVNISVYNIWIPARLQISERYIWINEWWDRVEKVIYLLVDACLNFYFIHIVRKNLVTHGLPKYKPLARFNMFIVAFSLSMDVLIISMMSLDNTFVYMQFHPLAYIVKLNIEMSMAELIGKIARNRKTGSSVAAPNDHPWGTTTATTGHTCSASRSSAILDPTSTRRGGSSHGGGAHHRHVSLSSSPNAVTVQRSFMVERHRLVGDDSTLVKCQSPMSEERQWEAGDGLETPKAVYQKDGANIIRERQRSSASSSNYAEQGQDAKCDCGFDGYDDDDGEDGVGVPNSWDQQSSERSSRSLRRGSRGQVCSGEGGEETGIELDSNLEGLGVEDDDCGHHFGRRRFDIEQGHRWV